MPIKIPNQLPATETLTRENIFVMTETRALTQDIRPLRILLLNLMPTKVDTETQFARVLGNTPLQIELELIAPSGRVAKNTPQEHMLAFYKRFCDVKDQKFDGLLITGAPVEHLPFEQVDYWPELCEIMEWSKTHVHSTLHICWGAQAALYYYYGIEKHLLPTKLFGIFPHKKDTEQHDPLLKGIDDVFYIPHSRHTTVDLEEVKRCPELIVLSASEATGLSIAKSKDNKKIFLTGHMEYDRNTLKAEYERDVAKGLPIAPPVNYFTDCSCSEVKVTWTSAANLFYTNWLNYYVYQVTPFKF